MGELSFALSAGLLSLCIADFYRLKKLRQDYSEEAAGANNRYLSCKSWGFLLA